MTSTVERTTTHFPDAEPGFNHAAAEAVYARVMDCPDDETAQLYGVILLGGALQADLAEHGEVIGKALARAHDQRARELVKAFSRSAIAKRRAGDKAGQEAAVQALGALIELSKAAPWNEATARRNREGEFARADSRVRDYRNRNRDLLAGRYAQAHIQVRYPKGKHADKPVPQRFADREGIPAPDDLLTEEQKKEKVKLTPAQRARYQHAYRQVSSMLGGGFEWVPKGEGVLHLIYADGPEELVDLPTRGEGVPLDPNKTLRAAKVSIFSDPATSLTTQDALAAFGGHRLGPYLATGAGEEGALDPQALGRFTDNVRTPDPNDPHIPSTRLFRRLKYGTQLLSDTLGDLMPRKVRVALKVGEHAGKLGPEAQKLLGPTADRTAYRYRGTERPVDPALTAALDSTLARASAEGGPEWSARREATTKHRQRGEQLRGAAERAHRMVGQVQVETDRLVRAGELTPEQGRYQMRRHAAAAEAAEAAHARHREAEEAVGGALPVKAAAELRRRARDLAVRGHEATDGTWEPGPVLNYLKNRLPEAGLNTLQHKAGTVPPSQGVIFDKNGKVATEAVGYADDWYLPFNLKNLSRLKGGEYLRTRSFGGPTPEDIYTGLVTGAKAVTVVSNNGVYTVEFDDALRGTRRYNDKAARMVGRYRQLLDAVRSGQVTTGSIDPTRRAELRAKAEARFPRADFPERHEEEMKRLTEAERRDPTLSADQRAVVAEQFLSDLAGRTSTRDGTERTSAEIVDGLVIRQAAKQRQSHIDTLGGPGGSLEDYQDAARRALTGATPVETAHKVADALGVGPQLELKLRRAAEDNAAAQKELELNGAGYRMALEALQEQFPYYIKRPIVFHPWADATNRRDTGYVRPTRLRPAEAMAGYFDTEVGRGKVWADSTRYQRPAGLRPVERGGRADPDRPWEREEAPREGLAERVRVGGRSPAAPAVPAAAQRLETDLEVLRALKASDLRFNAAEQLRMPDPRQAALMAGNPVDDFLGRLAQTDPVYATWRRLRTEPDSALAADGDRLHREIGEVLAATERHKLITLDPGLAAAHRSAGVAGAKADLGDFRAMLDKPDLDYDFGDAAYGRGHEAPAARLEELYARNPDIQALVASGLLPETVAAEGFDAASTRALATLGSRRDLLDRYGRGLSTSSTARPPSEAEMTVHSRGLLAARQLRRRYVPAREREQAAAAERAAQIEAERPLNQVSFTTPEAATAVLEQLAASHQRELDETRRTIEGQ